MLSTAQRQKSSNVLRVYLSSNDRVAGTSINSPSFNIQLQNQLSLWDPDRPLYVMVENMCYPTKPSYQLVGLCWVNMPLMNNHVITSNPAHNGIIYMTPVNNEQSKILNRNSIGYPLTFSSLLGLSTFNFQFVRSTGVLIADTDIGSIFWFSLVFWQD